MMEVKICGPGCVKCNEAYELATRVMQAGDLDADIIKVTDFQEIAQLGIFSTPAVVIDNEVKCVGRVPTELELTGWMS